LLIAPRWPAPDLVSLDSPSQYFPLVYTTFRIEHALWGLHPIRATIGFNILLHVANALLVWCLLAAFEGAALGWLRRFSRLAPGAGGYPVARSRNEKTCDGIFFFADAPPGTAVCGRSEPKRPWSVLRAGVGPLWALPLSAKSTAWHAIRRIALDFVAATKAIKSGKNSSNHPIFLLGLGWLGRSVWERYHQGTRGALFMLDPVSGIHRQPCNLVLFRELLWASTLTFIYPRWTISPANPLDYAWLLAAGGLCALIYFARRYTGRKCRSRSAVFVATLSPVLGFIMLYTFATPLWRIITISGLLSGQCADLRRCCQFG